MHAWGSSPVDRVRGFGKAKNPGTHLSKCMDIPIIQNKWLGTYFYKYGSYHTPDTGGQAINNDKKNASGVFWQFVDHCKLTELWCDIGEVYCALNSKPFWLVLKFKMCVLQQHWFAERQVLEVWMHALTDSMKSVTMGVYSLDTQTHGL